MDEGTNEVRLRDMRQELYAWLESVGVPEMGHQEANRRTVSAFLRRYAELHNETLKATCFRLSKSVERNFKKKQKGP